MENNLELVEIARSFSFKKNLGNYESVDFFCSQKAECKPEDVERVSEALYKFCKEQVTKSYNAFRRIDMEQPLPIVKQEKMNARARKVELKEASTDPRDEQPEAVRPHIDIHLPEENE